MIDTIKHNERRESFRRKSDRQFLISISMMFALVFLLGASIGYYEASREAMELIRSHDLDTRGGLSSHRGPDVENGQCSTDSDCEARFGGHY